MILSKRFRQRLALLLVWMFVWDLAEHLAAPAHSHLSPDNSVQRLLPGGGAQNPSEDPDCGFLDHGCALTHHHHFAAVLGDSPQPFLPSSVLLDYYGQNVAIFHSSRTRRPIRAPPFPKANHKHIPLSVA